MGRLTCAVTNEEDAMTSQIRISKMVIAAVLGGGVSVGLVPTGSHAQTAAGATVVSLTVKPKDKKIAGCDVTLNLENLPPGATAEFTTTSGRTFSNLHKGTYCLQNGVLTSAGGGATPAVVVPPPGGPPTGCTERTIIQNGSPITICQ